MPSVKPYSSTEVCELTGLTYRQLDYMCRTGAFGAAFLTHPRGSGNWRRFTDADLAGVEAVAAGIREERRIRVEIDSGKTFQNGRDAHLREHQEVTNG